MSIKKRYLFRLIVPAFPPCNVFSGMAGKTTALGPVCVATAANKLENWDVEIIDETNYKIGPKEQSNKRLPDHLQLQKDRPADIVGFYGSLTCSIPRAYKLAQLYKKQNVKTIGGGKHIEFLPQEALSSNIDIVVFSEGEKTIREILFNHENNVPTKNIFGIAYLNSENKMIKTSSRPLITDFDELPLPDFGLLRHGKKLKIYPINRSRGCNMNCEFCAVKERARCSSAERLLAQVTKLVETRKAKHFFIVDDHFSEQHEGAIEFCHLVRDYQKKIGRKLGFSVQIRLNDAKNTRLLQAMKEAGVNNVFIGYESPIDEELIAMRKGYISNDMIEWTKIFHRYGFFIHGMFIFGYPKPPGMKFDMSLNKKVKCFRKFINQAKIDTIQILLTVPLPGTDLRQRLEQQNRLYPKEEVGWEYYDGQFPLFVPDNGVSPEELQKAAGEIMGAFYHFYHFWKVGLKVILFPLAMLPFFTIKDIRTNFKHWHYHWWNDVKRFGGHILLSRWLKQFKKDSFLSKLTQAKQKLKNLDNNHLTNNT